MGKVKTTVLPENAFKKAPAYINAAYERHLGRSATKEEIQTWMKRPDDMGTITNTLRDSAEAKEFQGALLSVGDEPERAKAAWNRMTAITMKNTLGRAPTQAELDAQWDAVKGMRGEKLWHYGVQATANTEKYLRGTYRDEYKKADADDSDAAAIRKWIWKGPSNVVYGAESEDNEHLQRGQLFTLAEGAKPGLRSYDTGMRTSDGKILYQKGDRKGTGLAQAAPDWLSEGIARGMTFGTRGKEFWTSKTFGLFNALVVQHLGSSVAGIVGGEEARANARAPMMKVDRTSFGDRLGKNVNKVGTQFAPAAVSTVAGIVFTPAAGAAVSAALSVGTAATSTRGDVGKAAIRAAASLATAGIGQYLNLSTAAQAGVSAATSAAATKATGGSWSETARAGAIAAASPYLRELGKSYGWSPAVYGLAKGGATAGITAATGGSVKESLTAGAASGVLAAGGQMLQNSVEEQRKQAEAMKTAKEISKNTGESVERIYQLLYRPPATSPLSRPMSKAGAKRAGSSF